MEPTITQTCEKRETVYLVTKHPESILHQTAAEELFHLLVTFLFCILLAEFRKK